MSVDDWARREAQENYPSILPTNATGHVRDGRNYRGSEIDAGVWGIVHAFDALLSDEAVEAMARRFAASGLDWTHRDCGDDDHDLAHTNWEPYADEARAALQAAITAVTEGDKP